MAAAGGGTEAFPDLGRHCQHSDCHQLDFLPFTCDGCQKVFCLEHRGFKSHDCPKSDRNSRKVVVCEICSTSIETTGKDGGDETRILERHHESGNCNPSKKKKPTCAVKRCREILTFSNTCVCKICRLKVCLKHRFPAEHGCGRPSSTAATVVDKGRWNEKFMAALELRSGGDCGKRERPTAAKGSSPTAPFALLRTTVTMNLGPNKCQLISETEARIHMEELILLSVHRSPHSTLIAAKSSGHVDS